MNNKKINLMTSMLSLVLVSLLLVSVIFAWYTSNTTVTANGIQATTSSDQIKITKSILLKEKPEDNTLPETDNTNLSGLLEGSIFYYCLQIECVGSSLDAKVAIQIGEIIGGECFIYDDGSTSLYNVCDIYKIGLDEVWLNKTKDTLTEEQKTLQPFRESPTGQQNIYHFSLLKDYQWTTSEGGTITFIFKIKMDIAEVPETINRNQMGDKTISLKNILVLCG